MSKPPLPSEAVALLREPNPCVITTLRSDGAPVSTATWYLWQDDGRVLINMDAARVRVRHLRRDPRVSLTVLSSSDWYTHISLIGKVVEWREDTEMADIDALAQLYLGRLYPNRERPRVSCLIGVERWHGWGAMKDNDQVG
ncbi:PPOX class F420-dependent oxidoreductase [Nocardia alni]|uniref:PPOX class F420-dependent oxidoreductase n=1 Tax=Nocardia alni TaxID=2815723 RepID=UPI001C24CC6D|nr:PPOX class F420-dependent oxidoreductase [Nocardia alni]